jgi:hypothetical protein
MAEERVQDGFVLEWEDPEEGEDFRMPLLVLGLTLAASTSSSNSGLALSYYKSTS